ncbi:MAG TPA: hypothetical protein VL574_09800 [Stellaceae bacterium]|nr:hypothetical protein [Stellaceae bacterium]
MAQIEHAIDAVFGFIVYLLYLVGHAIELVDGFVRQQLAAAGVSQNSQNMIMIVVAVALLLLAFRFLGGVLRIALVVLVVLIAADLILPLVPHLKTDGT